MHFTRESIFVGAIRSFCTSIAVIVGLAFGIGVVAIALAFVMGPQYTPPKAQPIILPDAQGDRSLLPGSTPAILQIDFTGIIGAGDLTADKIKNLLLDSREDFLKGNRVKAILLHMNTPGGLSTDCDDIYTSLMDYKKKYNIPIYAYVDGLCASAGMYIACTADKIYASPASIIGSVGVRLGPAFNFSDAMVKVGVSSLTFTEGKDKDALNPFRPWTPNEGADFQAAMAVSYDRFVSIVSSARPKLTKDKLVNEYGAHIFISQDAENLGYIDIGNSNYTLALTELVQAAHIGEHDKYQVVQLMPQHPFLSELTQSLAPQKLLQWMGLPPTVNPNFSGKLLYLYQP